MSKEKKAGSLKALREARDAKVTELETVVAKAAAEGREFTPEEWEAKGRITAEIGISEDAVRVAEKAKREARKEEKVALARMGYPGYEINSQGGGLRVKSEHRTYEKGNGVSYLQDLCIQAWGPGLGGKYSESVARLQRHAQENHVEACQIDEKTEGARTDIERYYLAQNKEARNNRMDNRGEWFSYRDAMLSRRALSTTAGSGGEFVPPLFMTQEWLMFMRAARALADCQHHENLPDGTMNMLIPKVTAGTSVASQGYQNQPVSNTDLETAYVNLSVTTKAGEQVVSLQLLERSPIAFDLMTFMDLGKAHAQAVDLAVAAGDGTATGYAGATDVTGILNTTGINTLTWTQSTPTLQGLYGRIGLAKADIANTLFLPSTHCFMTPTRWEWISQSFDGNQRPLVVPDYQGPFNAVVLGTDGVVVEGAIGRRFNGLNTFEDANLPQTVNTNQDIVLVGRFDENWLFESPIVTRVLPQTYGNQLSVLLQVYGYMAFTAARYPNANSVITGTGLVYPPVFNS